MIQISLCLNGIGIYFFDKPMEIEMIKEHTPNSLKHIVPDHCPTTGQFAAVWEANNKVWAETYKWVDKSLYIYSQKQDAFIPILDGITLGWIQLNNLVKFYIQSN